MYHCLLHMTLSINTSSLFQCSSPHSEGYATLKDGITSQISTESNCNLSHNLPSPSPVELSDGFISASPNLCLDILALTFSCTYIRFSGRSSGTCLLISISWTLSRLLPSHKYSSFEYHAVLVTALVEVYVVITYHPPGQWGDFASLTHRPEQASPSSLSINVLCLSWGISTSISTSTFTSHQVHMIIMTQHWEAGVPF